jgi:hypothetical protein
MNSLRYRPGQLIDLTRTRCFLEAERSCFSRRVWEGLPGLIADLISRGAAKSYIVEDQAISRIGWFGLSAFAQPDAVKRALEDCSVPFREWLCQASLQRQRVFLGPEEIAEANNWRALVLVILICRPYADALPQDESAVLFRLAYDSFCFAHAGFGLSAVWQEVGDPERARVLENMGLVRYRVSTGVEGPEQVLLTYTPERAVAHPSFAMSLIFNSFPPRFGFSPAQQALLEAALLDTSDREFAHQSGLTRDAVKKRWRAIYDRVSAVDPDLVSGGLPGSDQRRVLLGYVRQHLEELRPIPAAVRAESMHRSLIAQPIKKLGSSMFL